MRISLLLSTCSAIAIFTLSNPALAEDERAEKAALHEQTPANIIVTAPFQRDRSDILSGASVLQGSDLTQAIRPSIGETLQHTPGVSATSFGPSASRPVLRGLQGERVRVLVDGIGSIDVSNTSVDHAPVVNPLLAERIEVLRGPQSLLFGASAIGGVVNVIDKRIPRSVPDEPVHIDAIATYGSAADERSGAGSVDVPLGDKFVVHADGSYLKSDNMRIGGYALSPSARAQALASSQLPAEEPEEGEEAIDFAGNAAIRGKLPNSQAKTWTAGVGAALITETGNLGVSYSHYDSLYGVPVRYATLPGQEQEAPRLDLAQDRLDLRAEVETGGGLLKAIRARASYADYRHFELEESGEVGTAFYNKGMEGRIELVQADHGPWQGASGVQYYSRNFNVVGEEAFLPKNDTQRFGAFTLQTLDYGAVKLEAGGRYEHSELQALPLEDQDQFFAGKRTFDTFSFSGGASYGFNSDWRLGVNLSRSERAPSAEELFANGPHAGTQAFEVGNPDFKTERAWGLEAVLRGKGENYSFEASAYHNWFSNFIYEGLTGEEEDGLPVYQFSQAKARYYGFEAQGSVTLATFGEMKLVADALGDYVHARIVGEGPAPRIPPLRLLGGLGVTSPKVDVRGEVEWTDDQKRVSDFETETKGFTLVNAQVNYRPWGTERPLSFALSANNIFDVVARRHASFLKDFAPLSGRDIRVTARVSF
ncbi:TonB-dependent receptor [Sphingobium soli]|uniref:TonB-dependent receptor n=1 Tax=Sphingobium soli TaxID=1591116 RepID=A0ABS8H7A6_9SPHN|nr:TonB-dependent receptor [Sphingobium soli]MCC4234436.1 TonB-dependent receptor [Sphingobium soli]